MTQALLHGILYRCLDEFVETSFLTLSRLSKVLLMARLQVLHVIHVFVDLGAHALDLLADVQRFQEVLARQWTRIDTVDLEK